MAQLGLLVYLLYSLVQRSQNLLFQLLLWREIVIFALKPGTFLFILLVRRHSRAIIVEDNGTDCV